MKCLLVVLTKLIKNKDTFLINVSFSCGESSTDIKLTGTLSVSSVKFGQTERAASLAEKFLDFGTLVELCEDTATGQKRIQHYMDFYANQVIFTTRLSAVAVILPSDWLWQYHVTIPDNLLF